MKIWAGIWQRRRSAIPLGLSFFLHGLAVVVILSLPPAVQPEPPPEAPVIVDVFTPQQFQALQNEDARITPSPGPTELSVTGDTIRPGTMLSGAVLNAPQNAKARIALAKLQGDTRLEQLCTIETMEQIYHWKPDMKPEWVVTSARSDTKTQASTYIAKGAAFRHGNHWYDLSFICEASPNLELVVAFEFTVGEPIPHNQLDRLNLSTGPDNHDHD